MSTPRLALVCHAPDVEPADHDGVCAEGEGFEDVGAGADARVEEDG